jgi:SIR2-like domain
LCIEAAQNVGARASPSPLSPGNVRGWVGHSLREWFRQINTGTAAAYAEFADKVIKPEDVIITFNYDDSLERELKRARKWDAVSGYGFPFGANSRPSDVLVLKLHGSMNWLWPVFSSAGRPVIHSADLEHLGYDDPSNFAGYLHQNGGSVPCLILPDREKKFFYKTSFGIEGREFWDYLWSQATEAVRRSHQLVLCGYSLLPVDPRACALLLNEPKKEAHITVVSGDQSGRIAADLGNAGFKNVDVFENGFFEDWVHQEVEKGTPNSN